MSVIRHSSLGDLTRGGQTLLHFIRMIGQVVEKFGTFLLVCLLLTFIGYFFLSTTSYERYVGVKLLGAEVGLVVFRNREGVTDFRLPSGEVRRVRLLSLKNSAFANSHLDLLRSTAKTAVLVGVSTAGVVLVGLFIFIMSYGKGQREETFIRGSRLVDASELKRQMRRSGEAGQLTIAGVPILRGSETSHILASGSPGTGKSTIFRELLSQIRKRGDRAVVYSTSDEFIKEFYIEGKDVILNPLDRRSPVWDIWEEADMPADFDNIAASMIPDARTGDPFWVGAARTLFSAVAWRMYPMPLEDRTTRRFLRDLLTIKLEEAAKLVRGTEAAAIISPRADKAALSVRSTLAQSIRSMKFLKKTGRRFSIRRWVENESDDSWIFITRQARHRETLRPLITTWIDIAVSAVMSLCADRRRRVWLIIDELPSLNKLPALEQLLAEGRKYGACAVIGFQSYSQLASIYGNKGADTIAGLCSTWVVYRANDPETAKWAANAFGPEELIEPSEALSYGANEIRDGVSLNHTRKTRPLLLASEIMQLPDLTGFLRMPGAFPIGKFSIKYKPPVERAAGYVEEERDNANWDLFSEDDPPELFDEEPERDAQSEGEQQELYRSL